jgi:hypothetical protein
MDFLSAEQIRLLSPKEQDDYIEKCFEHYCKIGFPHYNLSVKERYRYFKILTNTDTRPLWKDGNILHASGFGALLANSYHPQMWGIKTGAYKTPLEQWSPKYRDKYLRRILKKCISMHGLINDSEVRTVSTFNNTRRVANFKPLAAKAIYDKFLPPEGGIVYDPSCGFSGRLVGAISSGRVKKYIGTDPATETFNGLRATVDDAKNFNLLNKEIHLIQDGSENVLKHVTERNFVDLCFTSPPYFGAEEYSYEPTQSFMKFPTSNKWMYEFMRQTITNCTELLKDTGYIIINIADIPQYKTLTKDFIEMCRDDLMLEVRENKHLALRTLMNGDDSKGVFKYEPMFVFQTKGAIDWANKKSNKKLF